MIEYQLLMTKRKLCNHLQVSEARLERWRSEGIGPIYVKLGGQLRLGIDAKMFWIMRPVT